MILWGNKPTLPLMEPDSSKPPPPFKKKKKKILTKKAITGFQRLILLKTEYVWKRAEWLWHKLLWYIECKGKCNFFLPFSFLCSAEGWWFIFLSISVWRRLLLTPGKKGQMACVGGTCRRRIEKKKKGKKEDPSPDLWAPTGSYLAVLPSTLADPLRGGEKTNSKCKKHLKRKSISSYCVVILSSIFV